MIDNPDAETSDTGRDGEDGADGEPLPAILEAYHRLAGEKRFDEARERLAVLTRRRSGQAGIIRKLIVIHAQIPEWRGFCLQLFEELVALEGSVAALDPELLLVMSRVAEFCCRYDLAVALRREMVGRSGAFRLEFQMEIGEALVRAGRFSDAGAVIGAAEAAARRLVDRAEGLAAKKRRLRVIVPMGLAHQFTHAIGEMCLQGDLYFKARALGWIDHRFGVLVTEDGPVCNPALLAYWQERIPILSRSALGALKNAEILWDCANPLTCLTVPGLGGTTRHLAYQCLTQAWAGRGLPPTFTLRPEHREQGWRALKTVGLGEGDWFVPVHIRSAGWHQDREAGHNAPRMADVADYLPMFEAITSRGGWVVRLGDPSMPPLPLMARVFDYAHSLLKADWMDLFLCATARFMVGTTSGPFQLPVLFGRPVVVTNILPALGCPVAPGDMIIFKKIFSRRLGRPLTVAEMFSPPVLDESYQHFFAENELDVLANSPEEITDVCLQMLDALEGRPIYDAFEDGLWTRWLTDTRPACASPANPIGRRFLRNAAELLA